MQPRPTPESRSKRAGPSPAQAQHALITTSPAHFLGARQNNPQDCANLIAASVDRATVEISRTIIALNATFSQQLQQASISASNGIKAAQNSASQTIAIVVQNASIATSSAFSSVTVANRAVTSANFALSSASSQILSINLDLTSVSSASSTEVLRLSSSLSLVQANLLSVQASASSAIVAAQSALASLSISGSLAAASASSILASAAAGGQPPSNNQPLLPSFQPPSSGTSSLTPIQIAGIVIGAVLASIVLTSVICFIFIRKSKRRRLDSYLDEKGGLPSPTILPSQSRMSSAFRTGNSIKITFPKSNSRRPRASSVAASKAKNASKETVGTPTTGFSDDAQDFRKSTFTPVDGTQSTSIDLDFNEKSDTLVGSPRSSGGTGWLSRTSWLSRFDAKPVDQVDVKPVTTAPSPLPFGRPDHSPPVPQMTKSVKNVSSTRLDTHYEGAPVETLAVSPGVAPPNTTSTTSGREPVKEPDEETTTIRRKPILVPQITTTQEEPERPIKEAVEQPLAEIPEVEAMNQPTTPKDTFGDSFEDWFEDPVVQNTKEIAQESFTERLDFEPPEGPPDDPYDDPIAELTKDALEEPAQEPPRLPSKDSLQKFDFQITEGMLQGPVEEVFAEPTEEFIEQAPQAPSKDSMQRFDFQLIEETLEDPIEDSLKDPVKNPVEDPVEDPVENPIENPVEDPIEDEIEDEIEDAIQDSIAEPIEGLIEEAPKALSKDSVQRFDFQLVEESLQDKSKDPTTEFIEEADQATVDEPIQYFDGDEGNETIVPPEQPDDTLVETKEPEELAVDEVEASALPASNDESATADVDEQLRYSMGSEIDAMLRAVSQQSDLVDDEPSAWRDSFTRTALSPPLSDSSSPSPTPSRSPSPVREVPPERDEAEARALAEARDRTISPLRRNPVFNFAFEEAEPLPPLPVLVERGDPSPLRQNSPFQPIDPLLEEDPADDSPEEPVEEAEEAEELEEAEESDDRMTRGRSMIRMSDIIEARMSRIAQVRKEKESLEEEEEEEMVTEDEEVDSPPTSPVAIVISSPTDGPQMLRTSTLSPLRRNPVTFPEPSSTVATPKPSGFRPQKSSPLPTSSLLRPIPTATAALSREGSPLRRNPPGLYASSPLAHDAQDAGAGAEAGRPAAARPAASSALFSQALTRFRDLDAQNPQEAALASNEVTSRAIAGIYIPSSLREQAIRNLSKSRERSRSRMRPREASKLRS